MASYLFIALIVSLVINLIMFLIAFRYKSDKLTDVSYSLSFIAVAIYGLTTGSMTAVNLTIFAMIVIWAGRLGSFLLMRVLKRGKDQRFDDMRDDFLAFGRFWLLQAVTAWAVSLSSLIAFRYSDGKLGLIVIAGILVWLKGLSIEAVADLQKYDFTSKPENKNKWMETGLWHYSRHPNYLGEILVWTGIFLVTLPVLSSNEILIAALSPLLIVFLLTEVSGIPILEKSAEQQWGKDKAYQAYKKRTSVLLILPNKK